MQSPINPISSSSRYTPDEDDIQVHPEGAIRLICKSFQSHEAGLPEWIKNSADEYARHDIPKEQRIIIVLFDKGRTQRSPSISVLDFGGMTSTVIEQNFRHWADPRAATRSITTSEVQGGHGNGGKCYMTMMFTEHSLIHTVKKGLGNRYGLSGGSFRFGYDSNNGRDFTVCNVWDELDDALGNVGCSIKLLPKSAQEILKIRQGFTLVTGYGPKGYSNRLAQTLLNSLRDHPQMIRSLHLCDIFVMNQGNIMTDANPLQLKSVTPDQYINERTYDIPTELVDPNTEETVSTTEDGRTSVGKLILRTSDVNMRYSRKFLHNMVYHGISGYIGYTPMLELDVQSTYINRIYGECELASLEPAKQNARERLAYSPLVRAVEAYISSKVTEAREFEIRDRRSYGQQEKNELSRLNEILDKWKNQFISSYLEAPIGTNGNGRPPLPPPLPSGIPARIEVNLDHSQAGIGVSFRPLIKFYDRQERKIRPIPFQWISHDTNVAWVDPHLNVVNTFIKGETKIWAQTLDGSLESNKVNLRVIKIRKITLQPSSIIVASGSRRKIKAFCTLSSGETVSDVVLIWTEDNPVVAGVSTSGTVFGRSPGITTVTAGDDSCMANNNVDITVTEGSRGQGNERGLSYPKILVSSVYPDPETGEEVNLSYDDPPVLQRPQDADINIWWINSSAPLAKMYLDIEKGYGYSTREWRIYHVERYIEIIAQIKMSLEADLDRMESEMWILYWGQYVAAVQAAAATSLGSFIQNGDDSLKL